MQAKETTKKAPGTRGGGRTQDAGQTSKRERVLDVAERLFAAEGSTGCRCGISRRRQTSACR